MPLSPTSWPGGGGSYTPPVTHEQFFTAGANIAGDDAPHRLSWTKVGGDTLLDLTVPTLPAVVTAGIYAVAVTVDLSSADQAGKVAYVQLDAGPDSDFVGATFVLSTDGASAPSAALTLLLYLAAAATIDCSVTHAVVAGLNFELSATVQRVT